MSEKKVHSDGLCGNQATRASSLTHQYKYISLRRSLTASPSTQHFSYFSGGGAFIAPPTSYSLASSNTPTPSDQFTSITYFLTELLFSHPPCEARYVYRCCWSTPCLYLGPSPHTFCPPEPGDALPRFRIALKTITSSSWNTLIDGSINQICHIHIGQAGIQLGNAAWEL